MTGCRLICGLVLAGALGSAGVGGGRAQESPAVEHARRVLDLLGQEKYDEVAKEFNAQVAAALPPSQLAVVWSAVRQQAGPLKSIIDTRVASPGKGITAVTLGCQFERAALDVIIAFDPEGKIGGLRFTPRASASEPSIPPASSRFTEEAVTVGAGEWALPGTLSMPVGPIAGAVVLVHGSGPNDRDETVGPNKPFRDLAWGLADRGIAVLRYEKRTREHGAKMIGSIRNFTVREETVEDAVLAAALLRTRDRLDPKRVFVLGHSLGGTVAPRIAADDRALAGLIIMAGATRPILEAAREQFVYLASLTPGSMAPDQGLQMLRRAAPESYWNDLEAYKPAPAAAALTLPMLILQGERDYQVTLADLQGWSEALGGQSRVTIKSYPTLNHLFLPGEGKSTPAEYERAGRIPDFVLDDIADWIKKV